MTTEEAILAVQSWVKDGSGKKDVIPDHLIHELCESIYSEKSMNPSTSYVVNLLDCVGTKAIRDGLNAWKKERGLPSRIGRRRFHKPVTIEELRGILPTPISTAPLTFFDPANDGRWPCLQKRSIHFLYHIENSSIRNAMTLFMLTVSGMENHALDSVNVVSNTTRILMVEEGITDLCKVDPDSLFQKILERKACKTLSDNQRYNFCVRWSGIQRQLEEYLQKLTVDEQKTLAPFLLPPILSPQKLKRSQILNDVTQKRIGRAKAKTNTVHQRFHTIRFAAKFRLNQARRMYQATEKAIGVVIHTHQNLPYDFSYIESALDIHGHITKQRVSLRLWKSVKEQQPGLSETKEKNSNDFLVEHLGTQVIDSQKEQNPPWFLELFENQVFNLTDNLNLIKRRSDFFRSWGYETNTRWGGGDVLGFTQQIRSYLRHNANPDRLLFQPEGVYAVALFAYFVIRLMSVTGARLGEVQQVAQNPKCIKNLMNVAKPGASRWILCLVPKGRRERADYFIDDETKSALIELIGFQRAKLGLKLLPVVAFSSPKSPPDRFILQWSGKLLDQGSLNAFVRFLLHGIIINVNGSPVHFSSHILRHAFATELAGMGVRIDLIAKILNQRNFSVTRYYSQPTEQQVIDAAELLFVDRIDLALESKRTPSEVQKMLLEAEGKVGALTEVIGGTCTAANLCPAKFACLGCAALAPDPEKRWQVTHKLEWARQHKKWSDENGLLTESRQMKKIELDCLLVLEEMDLIEKANEDASRPITFEEGLIPSKHP